jgi:hypothetical protein
MIDYEKARKALREGIRYYGASEALRPNFRSALMRVHGLSWAEADALYDAEQKRWMDGWNESAKKAQRRAEALKKK